MGHILWYNDIMEDKKMTTETILEQIRPILLDWYRKNARDLPWRHTKDPYRIWVSEIMLQQTRVAAVLGYYARFLEAFPRIEDLAAAPEDQLMKLWEGLGYYSRARNLQKTAKRIVEQGRFPDTYEELIDLPGVGDYTASAVAAIAFGRREPAVDGNVLRVVTRITDCHDDILDPKVKKRIRTQLQAIMPENEADIRIFNQSVMELGATVCGPNGAPKCDLCPVADLCQSRRNGTAELLPVKKPKKQRRIEEKTVFVLLRDGQVALRQRDTSGLLAGLWEFPNVEGALTEQDAPEPVADWGLEAKSWKRKLTAKHIFTHVEWHMTGYVLEVSGEGSEEFLWVNGDGLSAHAVPSAFVRYYTEAQEQLEKGI